MHKLVPAMVTATLVLLGPTLARGPTEPVLVGGDDLDACPTWGQVSGLNAAGDNFLAVRDGPGTDYAKLDELYTGDTVILCDEFEGWYGIVYGTNCGVSSPVATRQPYAGPCASGWVSMRYITVTAG
jgi:hypothetical protein